MGLGTDDALTRWANDHRLLAGGVFGFATAVIVGVAVAIGGVPWLATALIALGSGLFVGLIIGAASRAVSGREHTYDDAAAARWGVTHPYLASLFGGLDLFAYGAGVLHTAIWVSAAVGAGTALLLFPLLKWVIPPELDRYDQGMRFLPPRPPRPSADDDRKSRP